MTGLQGALSYTYSFAASARQDENGSMKRSDVGHREHGVSVPLDASTLAAQNAYFQVGVAALLDEPGPVGTATVSLLGSTLSCGEVLGERQIVLTPGASGAVVYVPDRQTPSNWLSLEGGFVGATSGASRHVDDLSPQLTPSTKMWGQIGLALKPGDSDVSATIIVKVGGKR